MSCSIWSNISQGIGKKVQSCRNSDNFDRKAYISEEAANELKWWIRNIFDAFAPIKFPPFGLTTSSDTSLSP